MTESMTESNAPVVGAVSGVGGASPANESSPALKTSPGMTGTGKRIYLLSTGYVPVREELLENGVKLIQKKITVDEARQILSQGFTSAVGHESTANFLTRLLGIDVPVNRIQVSLSLGDIAVGFVLKTRLPEGKVLTDEEIAQVPFYLVLTQVSAFEG